MLAGFQNVLRQFHCFFDVAFVEIGFGHGSDNGQVDGIAGGGAVEVAFQRGMVVAARFAEEVEFVCRYAEADAVRFGDGLPIWVLHPVSFTLLIFNIILAV